MITRYCEQCNKEFNTYPSRIKKGRGRFCSIHCSLIGQKRHAIPHTDEAKIKISKNTGMSKGRYEGSRHWNWKGGVSSDRKHNLKLHYLRTRRRLLKKRNAEGKYTLEEWDSLKEKCGFRCVCCLQKEPDIKLEADHIEPIALGGTNYITNIQPLCRRCNARKHTKTIKYAIA